MEEDNIKFLIKNKRKWQAAVVLTGLLIVLTQYYGKNFEQTVPLPLGDEQLRGDLHQQSTSIQVADWVEGLNNLTLQARDRTGYWIGNTWIPPEGWRLFTPNEIRSLYSNVNMLWIGDSTGRRAAMTYYALMNTTDRHISVNAVTSKQVIDVSKQGGRYECPLWVDSPNRPKECRATLGGGKLFFVRRSCHHHIIEFIEREISGESNVTTGMDLIVVANGIHEIATPAACSKKFGKTANEGSSDLVRALDKFQRSTGKMIVLRTSGFRNDAKGKAGPDAVSTIGMNNFLIDEIDHLAMDYSQKGQLLNLTYVNWSGATEDRSFGDERIKGDMPPHYGLEPRLALIQMLTNALVERKFLPRE